MYMNGEGVDQDKEEAYYWAKLAAIQDPELAGYLLEDLVKDLSPLTRQAIDKRIAAYRPQ